MATSKKRKPPRLSSRHHARQLKVLVGTWDFVVAFPGVDETVDGTARIGWLAKNQLVTVNSRCRSPGGPPTSVSVIGSDDVKDQFSMLYADERDVVRIYAMTLTKATWTLERKAPRFSQRFIGRFGPNRRVIRGAWYKSRDGRRWHHDFAITYTKRRGG